MKCNRPINLHRVMGAFLCVGIAVSLTSAWAAPSPKAKSATKAKGKPQVAAPATPARIEADPVFATVNGKPITVREFMVALVELRRSRYYHGTVPDDQIVAVYKEVGDGLIERRLLAAEAQRRGIRPDAAKFEKFLADLDVRYADEPQWDEQREQALPRIKENADRQSLIEQLEKAVRDVPMPTKAEAQAFYDKRPELFTEPDKLRISLIMLKVDPSSSNEVWDKAREEANMIRDRIEKGADFAEEARLHSQDETAANGGDMGYQHAGMLPRGIEDKITSYQIGAVSEPVTTLDGVSLFKLVDRISGKLQEFAAVEKRAQELLRREWADEAWEATKNLVRKDAKIKIINPQAPGK